MFPAYKKKLESLLWMGVGSAFLSSIFSIVIISIIIKIYKRIS
jgi:hypothetical protein